MATYGGTRLGRQELDGELMGEAEGSLFPRAMLEGCEDPALSPLAWRLARSPREEGFDRIVVGVDPPASAEGDACGIVVAGQARREAVCAGRPERRGFSPERWARRVARRRRNGTRAMSSPRPTRAGRWSKAC